MSIRSFAQRSRVEKAAFPTVSFSFSLSLSLSFSLSLGHESDRFLLSSPIRLISRDSTFALSRPLSLTRPGPDSPKC